MENSNRNVSAINPLTTEILIIRMPGLSITREVNGYSASFSGMLYPLYSNTNKSSMKSASAINPVTTEVMVDSCDSWLH